MSSDSDLDEDELLQMALKEQSQNQKPPINNKSSSKSSQPPPRRNPKNNHTSTPSHSSRQSMDIDDDDSDVELLSISSGDEDASKDHSGGGGGVSKNRSRGGKDDIIDRNWDGKEANCWKRVDEAELARRVREMRETRAVPVAPEKPKPAIGRMGFTNLQSFPRGMECVDPLGLGIIDNKSLRLITESSESSPSKLDKDYLDNNLREKLMYVSDKFDAKLFLSRIHQNTRAADLEDGALALKTDLKGRTQQKKQLVKENFDCFVSCKTTIDDIESKMKRIEEDPEGAGTAHLYNNIQGVSSLANRAFEPLFERQVQAEKIRSVQGMLQRFRTLFNLPSSIRGSISKGEFDLAVREYMKAKSIDLPSHVGILKRVLEEVEKVMHGFKAMLYKSMEDPDINLAELENIVRLLLELEPESDPVWHYLNIQNNRIRGLLDRCTLNHEARVEALQNKIHERALSDARWKQIQQDSNISSEVDHSLQGDNRLEVDSQAIDIPSEDLDALRGRYIRRLTSVLIHQIPAFWKTALSVFSGKFAKSSQVAAENNAKPMNKTEDKVGDVKYSSHSLDEVAGMIRNTMSAYEVKVHNTFRDLEESNILCPFMSDAINDISKACQSIEGKESAPPSAVMTLRTLYSEITKIYIFRLCSWMRVTTEEISKDESWVPVSILERNKSPYTISLLPLAFRTLMVSAMDQINLMIQSLRSEATKSNDTFVQLQEIQESVRISFLNCFLDFAGHLERIGGEITQNRSNKDTSPVQNGCVQEPERRTCGLHPGSTVSDPHQKLLIVLSNIGYCKDELSSELYSKYKYIWLQSREKDEGDSDVQDLTTSFLALEEKVLAQYTFAKANLIRTAATNYLLDAGIQWGAAPAVKGVRDAAVELLHALVAVHAEVFAGAKPLLDKTLGILVEGLIDTFLSLFHENKAKELKSLDANGFCQLMLELEYFETILNPYFTPEASESLKSLQGVLLEKASESVTESSEPGHNRRPTRGSEDALADDRHQGMTVSPDDLLALAQQYSSELLQSELERTRINTACFVESIPLDSVPEPVKSAYSSFRGSMESPGRNQKAAVQPIGSPGFSRQMRR